MRWLYTADHAQALAEALAKALDQGQSRELTGHWIIVPSGICRHWILRQLAKHLNNDLAGVQVLTLHQFALEIFRRMKEPLPQVIEDKRYVALVWEILQEGGHEFVYPKNDPYPTVRRLYEVLRELRDAGVSGEEAQWLCGAEPFEGLSPRAIGRAQNLLALYHRYLGRAGAAQWTDGPEMMIQASERLRAHIGALALPPLWLWGFSDLVGVQKLFLKSLSVTAADGMTFFVLRHEATQGLVEEMIGWGFQEKYIGTGGNDNSNSRPAFSTIECPSPEEEAWVIAKHLRSRRSQGVPWSDCAIVARQIEPYRTVLERALTQNNIPFVMAEDPSETLGAKPVGLALKAALAFWERPKAAEALELVGRDQSNLRVDFVTPVRAVLARLLSLPLPILGNLQREGRLSALAARIAAQEDAVPRALRERTVSLVEEWVLRLLEGAALAEHPSSAGLVRWLGKVLDPEQPVLVREALERLYETISSLPAKIFSSRYFARSILHEMMDASALKTARTLLHSDGVWLLAAHQARGAAFGHVFLCGASNQFYPRPMEEDPYLSDAVRGRLNDLGFGLAPGSRHRMRGSRLKPSVAGAADEALLFRMMADIARSSVVISYPLMDGEGSPVLPSPYLCAFNAGLSQAGGSVLRSRLWEDRLTWLKNFAGAKSLRLLLNQGERRLTEAFAQPAGPALPEKGGAVLEMSRKEWTQWLDRHPKIAPTTLGNYLSCPQAFWMQKAAKLPGLKNLRRGEFYPAPALGDAFSKALVLALQKKEPESLERHWAATIRQAFPEIEPSDLGPAERYKLGRISKVLEELGRQIKGFIQEIACDCVEPEKTLALVDGLAELSGLECRADLVLSGNSKVSDAPSATVPRAEAQRSPQGRGTATSSSGRHYWELKLKRRSVFVSMTGKRSKPRQMLLKLLDPASPQGASYGLQILFYLLYAQGQGGGGAVTMASPYWEINQGASPPFLYSWDPSEADGFKEALGQWVRWFRQGLDGAGTVVFPFWPHENIGQRCGWCQYQALCGKNIPWLRSANDEITTSLKSSFEALKESRSDD
ncbi:MAG: PD-(D/E)XK nuclease family protein [Elusimicrobiota bacterium]